jgi:cell wall-associated NlpC family hydrolase
VGAKAIGIGAGAVVLLMPFLALLGVATLIAPPAAGSGGCLFGKDAPAVGSLGVTGEIPSSLTTQNSNGETVSLSQTQLQRAAAIIAVGKSENIPARGQLVALMAALTESSLRVLSNSGAYPSSTSIPNDGDGGDHDSVGLFQMRPSTGWGEVRNLMDPVWSSRAFYGGPDGPNHGSPRGLLDIKDWQSMDPGAAAQAVEVSAYPDRYAVNQPLAEKVLSTLTGVTLDSGACAQQADLPANLPPGFAGALITAAAKQIGTAYVWGGGNFDGPTGGGFDCSGLVLYAAYQASGGRLRLPHYTGDQIRQGRPVAWGDKQPGDLIFFGYRGADGPHHVAIYVGGDKILQAPHTGDHVRYGTIGEFRGQVMTVRRLG